MAGCGSNGFFGRKREGIGNLRNLLISDGAIGLKRLQKTAKQINLKLTDF